jgi:hypothetical protein
MIERLDPRRCVHHRFEGIRIVRGAAINVHPTVIATATAIATPIQIGPREDECTDSVESMALSGAVAEPELAFMERNDRGTSELVPRIDGERTKRTRRCHPVIGRDDPILAGSC